MATIEDFEKVDIRTGTILEVDDLEGARITAYRMKIDFGPEVGEKMSAAQITQRYTKKDLKGRQIIGVVNFPPRKIGEFFSEVLVLGVVNEDNEVVLLKVDDQVPNGLKIN